MVIFRPFFFVERERDFYFVGFMKYFQYFGRAFVICTVTVVKMVSHEKKNQVRESRDAIVIRFQINIYKYFHFDDYFIRSLEMGVKGVINVHTLL